MQVGQFAIAEKALTDDVHDDDQHAAADPLRDSRRTLLLGFAYEAQGKATDAEAAFRKAAARFDAALGADHLETAQAVNSVARTLIAQGRHDDAEPLFRQALAVFEAVEGGASDAAVAQNCLGLVCIARERYLDAIPYFERAHAAFERVHGPEFQEIVTVLRNKALAWKRLGELEKMAEAWERAEAITRAQQARNRRT